MQGEIYEILENLLDFAKKYWWQILAIFVLGLLIAIAKLLGFF